MTQRGVDYFDAETTQKIKEMTQRITAAQAEHDAQAALQRTSSGLITPEQSVAELQKAQVDAALSDFVHWVTHEGVRMDGQYRPSYTLYLNQGIPEHAVRTVPILANGGAMEESGPEALELQRSISGTPITERALSTSSTAVIPGASVLAPLMAEYEMNPVRSTPGVRIFATADGVNAKVPLIRRGATWDPGITAEAADSPERDPTLVSTTFGAHVYRVQITLSRELLQDNAAGLMGLLPQYFTEVFQSSFGSDCTTGAGGNFCCARHSERSAHHRAVREGASSLRRYVRRGRHHGQVLAGLRAQHALLVQEQGVHPHAPRHVL